MKKFVISNISGKIKPFKEVLKKADFDYNEDLLIVLGNAININKYQDVLEELNKIKNIVYCKGENEEVFLRENEHELLNQCLNYFVHEDCLFMFAGFNPEFELDKQSKEHNFDLRLVRMMETKVITGFDKVFMGRLSSQKIEKEYVNYKCRDCLTEWSEEVIKSNIQNINKEEVTCKECNKGNIFQSLGCVNPIKISNLYCINTGNAWDGKLTLFNIKTEEFYQSELQEPFN